MSSEELCTSGNEASRVDMESVLFLIVRHLRACGLSASAMALLHESGIDTAWLCGPAPELRLLRDWVFAGDFKRVKALLEPLVIGLAPTEHQEMIAIVDKQQLLETILLHSQNSHSQTQRALLDELHTRRNELQLDELELAWCLDALGDRSTAIPASQRHARATAQSWDVNESRMQCFERLVPFFRGEIGTEEHEHKYLAMPPTQLVSLLQDAVIFHRERAKDESAAQLDCISIRCYSTQGELHLRRNHRKEHFLLLGEPQSQDGDRRQSGKPLVSRSLDWAKSVRDSWTGDSLDVGSAEAKQLAGRPTASSLRVQPKRMTPVTISLDFDRMRGVEIRGHALRQTELILEEELESDHEDTGVIIANTTSANFEPNHGIKKKPVAKAAVFDVATQTEDGGTQRYTAVAPSNVSPPNETQSAEPPSPDVQPLPPSLSPAHERLRPFHDSHRSQSSAPSSVVAQSFISDSSHSICIDDDCDYGHAPSFVPAIRSPISRYLEEQNQSNNGEDGMNDKEGNEDRSIEDEGRSEHYLDEDLIAEAHNDGGINLTVESVYAVNAKDDPEQQRQPCRYDQLTIDHVVQASVVAEVKEAHAVRAIDMNADGSQLVIGTNARALRVFDLTTTLTTATSEAAVFCASAPSQHDFLPLLPVAVERHKHHQTSIYSVAFNNSSRGSEAGGCDGAEVVASGDADSCIKVLSLATNKEQLIQSHPGKSRALHFAAANTLWSSSTGDRRIRCWDLNHSPARSCLNLDGHVGEIQTLAFSSSKSGVSSNLLSAALDKTIRLWDTRSGKCEQIVARTLQPSFTVQFDPSDSRYFASGHKDGGVSVWDLRVKNQALETHMHHQDECRAISWSPDGSWLLSSSFDGTICTMQVEQRTKMLTPLASYHQHQDKILQAQWHPRIPAIVTTGADKLVKLWAFS